MKSLESWRIVSFRRCGLDDHPGKNHVIQLLDHFTHDGPNGTHLCLVFPVMLSDGQSMTATGRLHGAEYVQAISTQVFLGLDFLHGQEIIHCGMYNTSNVAEIQN